MNVRQRSPVVVVAAVLMSLMSVGGVKAEAAEPLHRQIDRLIEDASEKQTLAGPSSDAEFLRRVFLDLAGRIPTVAESEDFLADGAANKRQQVIDRLLAGDEFPRRMHDLFHAMLLERRGDDEHWHRFLRTAFERNLSWDQMARAMLTPPSDDQELRGAAYFMTVRLVSEGAMAPVDVPGLTRDVGRLLAGVDLQCAQCHDHIDIGDYEQRDFQGLHMIFENVQAARGDVPAVSENLLTAKTKFMSVFTQEPMQTGPRVPGGSEIAIPVFAEGEEYLVPPDRQKRTAGVPKFSPLKALADGLASPDNEMFVRNITNRLWFVMMGRGLVEPLDLHHASNPATHPEILDLLARECATRGFDIKWLLRELAMTEAYQRTSVMALGDKAPAADSYGLANERRLSAEQLFASMLIATESIDVETIANGKFEEVIAESTELSKLQTLFIKTFANPAKEPEIEFSPTVEAALFLMHDDRVLSLLRPKRGNLVDRLSKLASADEIASQLYLAILSRPATDADRREASDYLKQNENRRSDVIADLAWAMLTSTEFLVNH